MHKTATAYKPKSFSDIAPHATNFREQLPIKTLAHTVVAPPLKPQENINNNQGIIYDFSMWQSSSRIFGDSSYHLPQGFTFFCNFDSAFIDLIYDKQMIGPRRSH